MYDTYFDIHICISLFPFKFINLFLIVFNTIEIHALSACGVICLEAVTFEAIFLFAFPVLTSIGL